MKNTENIQFGNDTFAEKITQNYCNEHCICNVTEVTTFAPTLQL